jgi:hypothetical protein
VVLGCKLKKYWRIGKWIVIAADGFRENVARNKKMQYKFTPSTRQRKKSKTCKEYRIGRIVVTFNLPQRP